jgi:hypothetical protein
VIYDNLSNASDAMTAGVQQIGGGSISIKAK